MPKLKVIKKDGRIADFKLSKLEKSIKAAGVEDNRALQIATEIQKQLYQVPTSKIRKLVLEKLKVVHPAAADAMIEYDIRKAEVHLPSPRKL